MMKMKMLKKKKNRLKKLYGISINKIDANAIFKRVIKVNYNFNSYS